MDHVVSKKTRREGRRKERKKKNGPRESGGRIVCRGSTRLRRDKGERNGKKEGEERRWENHELLVEPVNKNGGGIGA